jgi:predicted DCC family thiol-disulfide oxidoreductase YuxK
VTTLNPPADAASTADHAVVLFDGACNLCSASVRFVLARDRTDYFRFASLQSEVGRALLVKYHVTDAGLGDGAESGGADGGAGGGGDGAGGSIVLIENGRVFTRSTAALRIARRLKRPWPVASLFLAIPRPLRDAVYNFIARHRYRWFGRADACAIDAASGSDLQRKLIG